MIPASMGMAQLRRVIVAALAVALLAAGKRRQAISCGLSHYASRDPMRWRRAV